MDNSKFLELAFGSDYWERLDRSMLSTDPRSLFGDEPVFSWLLGLVRPRSIIEVGSWMGHSANFMADECRKLGLKPSIVCVDTYLGAVEHWTIDSLREVLGRRNGRPTMLERFQGNTIERGNTDMIHPFPIDSENGSHVMRETGYQADLIFIDAAHGYDAVVADIENYWPLLSERGVMFGDDYQFEPLAQAVHDCAEKLGVQVLNYYRKWVFFDQRFANYILPEPVTIRTSREGWVHP